MANRITQDALEVLAAGGSSNLRVTQSALEVLVRLDTAAPAAPAAALSAIDPQISLQYSDDGGRTWSNELLRSMGKIGEFKKRVRWLRLGRSRNRVFKVVCSEPVAAVIVAADINPEHE